jgi:hypothetical protein
MLLGMVMSAFASGTFKRMDYIQGQVTDALIVSVHTSKVWDKIPEPRIHKRVHVPSGQVTVTFFVPAFSVSACALLKKVTTALYNIRSIPVVSPVQGVRIELTYEPHKLAWQYYTLLDVYKQYRGGMLLLHEIQAIDALVGNTLCCPVRWYSGIKHQPRIVLGIEDDKNRGKNRRSLVHFMHVLRALLVRQGCEVFTFAHPSYVHCHVQSDLCIMLRQNWLCPEYTYTEYPYTTYTKRAWSTLAYSQEKKLKQLHACKRARAGALVHAINKINKHVAFCFHECDAYQTPTVMLAVGNNVLLNHAQAIAYTVKRSFRQKNNLALY